ncbi:hypothetical protein P171DRAFT_434350 [Karstenula rhodostoma CBS 690.94]|uniref:Secreted protein n=1 Tax=Karstenula rhodostoma CBS 690.94 TaxID=1392251 RepID=A0A9P4U900_9PLEO|nr:hypothetical protein P171DRAFT_434350 [Karstenula rhodostoma CBS 690.94]
MILLAVLLLNPSSLLLSAKPSRVCNPRPTRLGYRVHVRFTVNGVVHAVQHVEMALANAFLERTEKVFEYCVSLDVALLL